MDTFKEHIIKAIKKEVKVDIELETPPDPDMGDYAFPCFSLAKKYKKNPNEIALDLSKKIKKSKFIDEIKVEGPYLNFFVNKKALAEETLNKVLKEKDKYGSNNIGKNKKIILEHTSVNPNASPHVGRARNALIGDTLARILKFQNYNVEVHFWVNDIGKQISMLVLGARNKKNITFDSLLKIYQDISKKVENSPEKEKEVLNILYKLEQGDKKIKNEFKKIVDIAVKGQTKIFKELGIEYDVFDYESYYLWSKKTREALDLLEKTGKFYFDKDNRVVLDQKGFGLGMKMPVLVLTRGDGTSLYPLRDIAYALDIEKKGRNIVVLGEDQKLYNQQINAALLMLEKKKRGVLHYSFVLLEEGKMSTRKGNLVLLEDFMKEAEKKAHKELKQRYKKIDKKAAKTIAYGALKYSILKVSPEKNVTFNWQQALSFEGETAPYTQYAYARICSIIKKNKKTIPKKAELSLLNKKEETELIKKIALFPKIAEKAAKELRPNIIATYAYELAKLFNEFYHMHNILKEEIKIKQARLLLALNVKQTLSNSLNLLGIQVLEKM
ncbi:arginine--tRNA ligase [Candidatus Woesearchaeota archaeon]|nr:arginine--tRNA ligase [Candidatus Woesearchaeota archaeon]|tara:strand:- start:545 stop:2206 length:1662 start_codon:yes stop_codon:yes gene_type:complete